MLSLLLVILHSAFAAPAPGAELALVLDNSCSMFTRTEVTAPDGSVTFEPANDPERAAVLGALVVEGLARGSLDGYTAITLPDVAGEKAGGVRASAVIVRDAAGLRNSPYVGGGTASGRALQAATEVLARSTRKAKLLVYFTDGSPSDLEAGETLEGYLARHAVLGAAQRDFDAFAIGLYRTPRGRDAGDQFLRLLVRDPVRDLVLTGDGGTVVPAFVRAFARAVGSMPQVFQMNGAHSRTLTVPRYATEVLVAVASNQPGPAFSLTLTGGSGAIAPTATGDNGCSFAVAYADAPDLCKDPRRHYVTYRAAHDPSTASSWTLASAGGTPLLDAGVIYRHGFDARVDVPAVIQVGQATKVVAQILRDDGPFTDAVFLSDKFSAAMDIAGTPVSLTHVGGGVYEGTYTATAPMDATTAKVTFSNSWLDVSETTAVRQEGIVDLAFAVPPLDLGAWEGSSGSTERCAAIDLSGSRSAEAVPIQCTVGGLPDGYSGRCEPDAGRPVVSGQQPLLWKVCVVAPPCCKAASGPADVLLLPSDARYAGKAVHVPLGYAVMETGFLRCWGRWIEAIAALLGIIFVIIGIVRPYSFDEGVVLRIASSEAKLAAVSAQVLRDLPKGRRGFYRNARVSVDSAGECIPGPRGAVLVVVAGPNATLRIAVGASAQYKNRSTGKWTNLTPEDMAIGPDPGTVYKAGKIYMKFGG